MTRLINNDLVEGADQRTCGVGKARGGLSLGDGAEDLLSIRCPLFPLRRLQKPCIASHSLPVTLDLNQSCPHGDFSFAPGYSLGTPNWLNGNHPEFTVFLLQIYSESSSRQATTYLKEGDMNSLWFYQVELKWIVFHPRQTQQTQASRFFFVCLFLPDCVRTFQKFPLSV